MLTFSFRDTEVCPDSQSDAEDQKEVERAKRYGVKHSGRDQCDDKVREVVCRNGKSDCLPSDGRGKHLRRHDPVDTSNAECESGNVQPHKDTSGPAGCVVLGKSVLVHSIECCHNELSDGHANGARDQSLSTTPSVQVHDRWDGGKKEDDANHSCGEEIHGVTA